MDTARELRNNTQTRRETTWEEREKDSVRGNPQSWGMIVTEPKVLL